LEPVRNGDNDIAFNAQKAEDLAAAHEATQASLSSRLGTLEHVAFEAGAIPLIEDPADPGFYLIGGTP
jgi:hypothetical protein